LSLKSFNIVTADFVYNGKPIVVSPDISWLSMFSKANPNSSKSIIRGLNRVAWLDKFGFKCINIFLLERYNRKSLRKWLRFFKKFSPK